MPYHKSLKFNGSLGEYEVIKTSDGSTTVYSEFFNEACHSHHGADTETQYIYVDGCEVAERNVKCIFETGFGVGNGWQQTLKSHDSFLFYSTELDENLIHWAQGEYKLFDELTRKDNCLVGVKKSSTAIILLGDARKTVKKHSFDLPFEAIYQDPFSPKRNPSLWTKEWFELLASKSAENVILSTYSASSRVKKSLFETGWIVEERKGFAAKRSATRAFRVGEMDSQLIEKLQNPKIDALTDKDLQKIS